VEGPTPSSSTANLIRIRDDEDEEIDDNDDGAADLQLLSGAIFEANIGRGNEFQRTRKEGQAGKETKETKDENWKTLTLEEIKKGQHWKILPLQLDGAKQLAKQSNLQETAYSLISTLQSLEDVSFHAFLKAPKHLFLRFVSQRELGNLTFLDLSQRLIALICNMISSHVHKEDSVEAFQIFKGMLHSLKGDSLSDKILTLLDGWEKIKKGNLIFEIFVFSVKVIRSSDSFNLPDPEGVLTTSNLSSLAKSYTQAPTKFSEVELLLHLLFASQFGIEALSHLKEIGNLFILEITKSRLATLKTAFCLENLPPHFSCKSRFPF